MITLLLALLLVFAVGQIEGMTNLPWSVQVRVLAEIGQLRIGLTTVRRRRVYFRIALV